MVNCASTAPSPDKGYPHPPEFRHVYLLPGVLVSTYDNTWVVSIKQQQRIMMRFVLEQPAAKIHFVSRSQFTSTCPSPIL